MINKNKKLLLIMKTFKEFLEESSLSRIKSKSDKGGMQSSQEVVVTNQRKKIKQEQNN